MLKKNKALFIILSCFVLLNCVIILYILPYAIKRNGIKTEEYFKNSNFIFTSEILKMTPISVGTAGVFKLKFKTGYLGLKEGNLNKSINDIGFTGTFNPKDSTIYMFSSFYVELQEEVNNGFRPKILKLNSKKRKAVVLDDNNKKIIFDIYYYDNSTFKRRDFFEALSYNEISFNYYW